MPCWSSGWPLSSSLSSSWSWIVPLLVVLQNTSICVSTFLILFITTVAFYRICLHPLSHIPGPRLAALTTAWYAYQVRNGRMLHLGTTLHRQYGPVVRVGPNELWFDSKDAFRLIYSPTGGYEKSSFYRESASLLVASFPWNLSVQQQQQQLMPRRYDQWRPPY